MMNKLTNPKESNIIPYKSNGGDGGGIDMSRYVTKQELETSIDKILLQMDKNHNELINQLTLSNQKIDYNQAVTNEKLNHQNEKIEHSQAMINEKLNYQNEQIKEVDNRLNTIIGIGITSIIIPIFLKALGF